MKFYVTGPINEGTVSVHLIRDLETSEYKYWLLALDCKGLKSHFTSPIRHSLTPPFTSGHQRLYLENEEAKQSAVKRAGTKIFGIQWR